MTNLILNLLALILVIIVTDTTTIWARNRIRIVDCGILEILISIIIISITYDEVYRNLCIQQNECDIQSHFLYLHSKVQNMSATSGLHVSLIKISVKFICNIFISRIAFILLINANNPFQ